MPGSEQAALLPLPIVRDAIRPRSLPFDSDDSSLGCRFGRNQGRFRPNRQPCAPQQTNEPPSSPCDVYPDFSDVYMNSSGNTALSYKNGMHKSKRCYTPGFRRKPTCYFFRKRSKTPDPQEGKMSNPWEKEKKSYQSTIEKLVARKADIYAHLGAAIAYQAKDDPAVLLPYPIQAAALNDIEQKTEAFRKRMARPSSAASVETT